MDLLRFADFHGTLWSVKTVQRLQLREISKSVALYSMHQASECDPLENVNVFAHASVSGVKLEKMDVRS